VEEKEIEKTEPNKKKHLKISWWLIVVAILAFGGAFYCVSPIIKSKQTLNKTQPDTKEEINVKQKLSSLRGDIDRYFEANKTYEGWTPNAGDLAKVKAAGSEIKTKLSKDGYMIYAKMPNSKLIFCMDKTFTGEMNTISSSQKTCK